MSRSKQLTLPLIALLIAGISWGTTAIFVRVLALKGFTSFELLEFRLVVVGAILLPGYLAWLATRKTNYRATLYSHGFRNPKTYLVGASMVLYYLGAIVAVQNLPLVLAVLLIGSSPLMAWLWPLVREKRLPKPEERLQGFGVGLGILGLLGFALAKADGMNSVLEANPRASPVLGYLSGLLSAAVTVLNSRILKSQGETATSKTFSSPVAISIVTSAIGLTLFPFFFMKSGSMTADGRDVMSLAQHHYELLIGFGVIATLIPGLAQAYASTKLSPVLSSTVTIQLQLWTAVFGWLILDERLSAVQFVAAAFVFLGTLTCLLGTEAGARGSNRLK